MFPARFDYVAPTSVDEVLTILDQRDTEAKVLAGGQSLIPLMKLRFASPDVLVDINKLPDLAKIEETSDSLRIGALVRHNEVAKNEIIGARYPAIAVTAPLIADPIIRNRGTMGGSLAHADPAGDWGAVMLALEAELVARSSSGERVIPIAEFLKGTFTTALQPTELLIEIRVPKPQGRFGGTYMKLERKVSDFATVGVAVHLEVGDGTIDRAGIALTAVGRKNIKATDAEQSLVGAEPTNEAFKEAARLAERAAEPASDLRGSAEYKRAVVRTFVERGLQKAHSTAMGLDGDDGEGFGRRSGGGR